MVSTTNVSSEDGTTIIGREIQLIRYPQADVRSTDFRIVEVEIPELRPGEVLVRNTWMSVDLGLRLRLREKSPDGYWDAMPLGTTMTGVMTVGEVVASRAPEFEPGMRSRTVRDGVTTPSWRPGIPTSVGSAR